MQQSRDGIFVVNSATTIAAQVEVEVLPSLLLSLGILLLGNYFRVLPLISNKKLNQLRWSKRRERGGGGRRRAAEIEMTSYST